MSILNPKRRRKLARFKNNTRLKKGPLYAMRYSAEQQSAEKLFVQTEYAPHLGESFLSDSPEFSILVWNIFKQKRAQWLSTLQEYAKSCQLVLLQEAHTTPELIAYAKRHFVVADQVPALTLSEYTSGVMTLSSIQPIYCCPLQRQEPLIRLYKSALITVYPLQDGQNLMVANIHAINFSVGVLSYQRQLAEVIEQIQWHIGPVILAGDFNSWSKRRMTALYRVTEVIALQSVNFNQDLRKKVFGKPLDFIFYRGLSVRAAQMLATNTSDHNPMRVTFSVLAGSI